MTKYMLQLQYLDGITTVYRAPHDAHPFLNTIHLVKDTAGDAKHFRTSSIPATKKLVLEHETRNKKAHQPEKTPMYRPLVIQ